MFINIVQLVENEHNPQGVTLVNTKQTTKAHDSYDLVELAKTVQKAKKLYY